VVRFVYDDGTLCALKELSERLARREYRLLRVMADLNIPVVEAVGIAVDRGGADPGQPDDAIRTSGDGMSRVAGADPGGNPAPGQAAVRDR
jgi:hypothetical protein